MNQPNPTPLPDYIPLDPRDGGALNWFDMMDDQGRVCLRIFGDHYPTAKGKREAWLIKHLRGPLAAHQHFFFRPLAHKGLALDFRLMGVGKLGWEDLSETYLSVPLAQLFLLPNQDPDKELSEFRSFLEWVDRRSMEEVEDPVKGYPTLQWYRSGYGNRGLDWALVPDPQREEALNQELAQWLEKPVMKAWRQANLDGISRIRMGPWMWLTMPSLVPDRRWAHILEKTRKSPKAGP